MTTKELRPSLRSGPIAAPLRGARGAARAPFLGGKRPNIKPLGRSRCPYSTIRELDLTSCRLGSDSCGMLPAAISANGVIKRIRLDGNRLGVDLGAQVRGWFGIHAWGFGVFLGRGGARCAFFRGA